MWELGSGNGSRGTKGSEEKGNEWRHMEVVEGNEGGPCSAFLVS